MKYKNTYEQINALLKIIKKDEISPLPNNENDKQQIENLYNKYLDMYLKEFPQWIPYKDRPQMINDIGMSIILQTKNAI
jgi:hypothetical protein